MRRALVLGMFVLAAAIGFYVAWPAWSARQIAQAIEANDASALERRVDFLKVRARAVPVFEAELKRRMEQLRRDGGSLGAAVAAQFQSDLVRSLARAAVDSLLTPQRVIDAVRQGRDLRRALQKVPGAEVGAGGNGGTGFRLPGSQGAQTGEAGRSPVPGSGQGDGARQRLGLRNIKSYRLTGPLAIAVGVARDAAAAAPEVTVEMAFVDGGWKVVGIVPQF